MAKVVVFDRTCRSPLGGLSALWSIGAEWNRTLGRFDACFGASHWQQALRWLADVRPGEWLEEVQFWGHGKWGEAWIGGDRLSMDWLDPAHKAASWLQAIRDRMRPDGRSLWWFRTCETLGGAKGQSFAQAFSDRMGVRVAGHTHVIALAHSGLHLTEPGSHPNWDPTEGIRSEQARHARGSSFRFPRTIGFWRMSLPNWTDPGTGGAP